MCTQKTEVIIVCNSLLLAGNFKTYWTLNRSYKTSALLLNYVSCCRVGEPTVPVQPVHHLPPGVSLIAVCVSHCSEAGYVATPIAMVQAALTVLNEPAALPKT